MNKLLYQMLNIDLNKKEIISFVGAGGKTTAIFKLAKELRNLKKKVLISTTTHIFLPNKGDYDKFYLKDIKPDENIPPSSISVIGEKILGAKLKGLGKLNLEKLIERDLFDFYLIEADGAKLKAIKAPNCYEPVIVDLTSKTVGLIGLDALGEEISNAAHRYEILMDLLNKNSYQNIEIEDIVNLTLHRCGLFKDAKGETILLLNKADSSNKIQMAKTIRKELSKYGFKNVIISNILTNNYY